MANMTNAAAPYHAHIYYTDAERPAAEALRAAFERMSTANGDSRIQFVGAMTDGPVGPHPIPQYEIHFAAAALPAIVPMIEASGLRGLVHPLTADDLADHTSLAHWIGAPLDLDLTTLDPPGENQGVPRFGKTDF